MDSRRIALLCCEYAGDKKAEDILALEVRGLSTITDYFVLVTGTSEPHLRGIFNEIEAGLRENHQIKPMSYDGKINGSWIVIDYFDVIVHVMRTDLRKHYDLEALWGDAPRLELPERIPVHA